jgi:hypothetical protein
MSVFVRPSAGKRFGSLVRMRAAGDFAFRLSRYAARLTTLTHHHAEPFFCCVVRGLLIEHGVVAGETFLADGSVRFHAAGDPHSASAAPRAMACLSIVPSGEPGCRAAGWWRARR